MPFCLNNQEQMMIMLNCCVWQIQGIWSKLDDVSVYEHLCHYCVLHKLLSNCSILIQIYAQKQNLYDLYGEFAKSIAQNVANCIPWSEVCCDFFFCLFLAYQSTSYLSTAHVKYVFITVHQTVTGVESYWWLFTCALIHLISTVVKY